MSRSLTLFFAMLGIAMIMWPGGASAQYYDDLWGPFGPYGAPPMGHYGPPQMQVGPQVGFHGRADYGGRWEDYIAKVDRANRSRRETRLDDVCASFCTLMLSVHNVCVTRNARFGFHGISYGGPDSQNIDRAGNAMYLRRLPRQIQVWVLSHRALNSKQLKWMSGSEAISLGIRECS